MKKKALAFAAAACAFGMLLSGCGSSNGSDTAAEGANIITAYNSERSTRSFRATPRDRWWQAG